MARRVSSTGVLVEQKPDVNMRRVSAVGLVVEQKPDINMRQVSSAGIMVEWQPIEAIVPTGIASAEAFGSATVIPGSVELLAQGTASAEAFGTALVTIGIPNYTLYPTGIASLGAFGTPTITQKNYETFFDYIVLGGRQYRTVHKSWIPEISRPMTSRELLSGDLDATFGSAVTYTWEGEIVAPNTVDDASWGTIANLRTTLKQKTSVTYIDHYGTSHGTSYLYGPFPERSPSPVWDDHPIYVKIKIRAKE